MMLPAGGAQRLHACFGGRIALLRSYRSRFGIRGRFVLLRRGQSAAYRTGVLRSRSCGARRIGRVLRTHRNAGDHDAARPRCASARLPALHTRAPSARRRRRGAASASRPTGIACKGLALRIFEFVYTHPRFAPILSASNSPWVRPQSFSGWHFPVIYFRSSPAGNLMPRALSCEATSYLEEPCLQAP